MGFPRQEYWSGLPLSSPEPCIQWVFYKYLVTAEAEHDFNEPITTLAILICKYVLVAQSFPTLCDLMDCSPPGSSVHRIPQQEYWSGLPFLSPGDLPDPGIEPESPTLQADASPSEPPGKPVCIMC